ncbi:Rieske (2Fe-2S) protein [Marinitenerispora sediminis]|uniref:Cytochrome bc1 complex Rieske iron-sulfur subunit n=1 Tax=Marinitenerispora sediminis TaxID=1931232 RepID=A0A368T315_9ACTN|nr:Rieske (2Fe-2S) protein [Marinitenerispora sediminis]RCV54241.1 iron-sulfur protein [Marinitenerispora sediminis]RCV55802.1 iron-sulfur protein [Marinitenerispora sediminis]RCV59787.1 iron-sulfur protein [Marinitenerispora sediminis]
MSRRRLLGAAGAAGAAAVGASACTPPEDRPRPQDSLHGQVVAQTTDVPVGGGQLIIGDKLVVTQPTEGEFRAFSAVCSHGGCTVQEVTDVIHCLCHGSVFGIADGDVLRGPATQPLEAFEVTVEGTDITLV